MYYEANPEIRVQRQYGSAQEPALSVSEYLARQAAASRFDPTETLLIVACGNRFCYLNATASLIFATLANGGDEPAAVEALLDLFSVDRAMAEDDVRTTASDLVGKGLLLVRD